MGKYIAKLYSAELEGVNAKIIEVEADINVGLHSFNIVGLADKALNEAKERVNAALKNSSIKPPSRENRRITINLAPADIRKTGSHYDLAIALGYLLATRQIKNFKCDDKLFLGELALDGRLRPVAGVLSIAECAALQKFKWIILPRANAREAEAVKAIRVVPVSTLAEAIDFLETDRMPPQINENDDLLLEDETAKYEPDFSEVKGQDSAKRALTIAAAGSHNLLMTGPPGVGKSLLARTLRGIMPPLDEHEAIEVTKIWSAAGFVPQGLIRVRPFRAPHQTASRGALVGGGQDPRPGEISLAHHGILFLDELPEFSRATLEALREPLESGVVRIARAKHSVSFPAQAMLVAAMNPCPCGYYGDQEIVCKCLPLEVSRYQKRLSGPLLDRIDICVKLGRIALALLRDEPQKTRQNAVFQGMIGTARAKQQARFAKRSVKANAMMTPADVREHAQISPEAENFLKTINGKFLSPRGYYRMIKVARTIADLDNEEKISAKHLAEAFSYRFRNEG